MKKQLTNKQAKILAVLATVALFFLIWLYTREFMVFTNTIGATRLVVGALLFGALVATGIIYRFRARLVPWERHMPETGSVIAFFIVFSPLFASLLNRASTTVEYRTFTFVSEQPYLSSNYGLLKGEEIKPSGYRLTVTENGRRHMFQYKSQAYYPLTKPGEPVLLPMRQGLLGFEVLELK